MKKQLLIRDVTLRDGQQSLFATRMHQKQIDRVLPLYREAGFYAMEVWGGAVPDSAMRYLDENPWQRLEKIKETVNGSTKLTALSRGRNLFGYNPYPDEVIEGFNRHAIQAGISIMRIFDALNDVENMKSTVSYVKENGGIADCAVCYTVDSKVSFSDNIKCLLQGKKNPKNIFSARYFVGKAKEMESLGADIITIKDMAGLISPAAAGELIRAFKDEISVPVNLHTHCTPGYGLAAVLVALVNGVDIVDTAIMNFAGGPAAPAFELVQIFAEKLGYETNINLAAVGKINAELGKIRRELNQYEQGSSFPREFNIAEDKLPPEIEELFDTAVEEAITGDMPSLLEIVHQIERYFQFPEPNEIVKHAQIPGGMYTNMVAQLKQLNLEKYLDRALKIVPQVRMAAGCPPLVTPTSQIVGVQAVNCIVDQANNKPFYSTKSTQFINLVKGIYGKTPVLVNPEFREKITGESVETPFDPVEYQKPENTTLAEFGDIELARDEREILLLELFPAVAAGFLKNTREKEYNKKIREEERAEQQAIEQQNIDLAIGLSGNYLEEETDETIGFRR